MNILIDLVHSADVNFYKAAVKNLEKNHNVVFTVLDRGRLITIIKKEYPNTKLIPLGKHRKGKYSKIIGIIDREFKFVRLFMRKKYDRVSSFGFYPAIASKIFGIKSIIFHDDYEYKLNFNLCKKFASRFVIPNSIPSKGKNIVKYSGYKELAYLKNFKPNRNILKKMNLIEDKYIFVRDIASISLNYSKLKIIDYEKIFQELCGLGYRILYYPEDKSKISRYKKYCTILESPVDDILSLIYYARFTISSGDTIARESALLGTPIIYTGERTMVINKELQSLGALYSEHPTMRLINNITKNTFKNKLRRKLKQKITKEWNDTTKIILREIEK